MAEQDLNKQNDLLVGSGVFPHPFYLEDHIKIAMVKDMKFRPTIPALAGKLQSQGKFVQLGAGKKLIAGWDNLDYPKWDAHDGLPYEDESVDGIASYHTLDHLDCVIPLLADIQRVLKPRGWFVNIVPHYSSELWHTDLTHKSQFGVDTWRNIFSERHYDHEAVEGHTKWRLGIEFNMMMAFTERNAVLVTKLVKVA